MSVIKFQESIAMGVDRSNFDHFDDSHRLKMMNKISQIKICVGEQGICGIQFIYELVDGKIVHGHNSCESGHNIIEFVFNIANNDFLQVVFGSFDGQITQLGFITYRGKESIYGIERGRKFKHLFMGFTFTSAFGAHKHKQLDFLGLRVVKLPREYLEMNWQPLTGLVYNAPYQQQTNIVQPNIPMVQSNFGYPPPPQEVIYQQPAREEVFINQFGQEEIIYKPPQTEVVMTNNYQYPQMNPYPQEVIVQNQFGQTEIIEQRPMYQQPMYQQPQEVIIQNQYGQTEIIQQRPPQPQVFINQYGQEEIIYNQPNNMVVINEQDQYYQQQQQQKQGMGAGTAMMMGAVGGMMAMDMIDHHHRREDVFVVEGHHHHHHGR